MDNPTNMVSRLDVNVDNGKSWKLTAISKKAKQATMDAIQAERFLKTFFEGFLAKLATFLC